MVKYRMYSHVQRCASVEEPVTTAIVVDDG